jgi:hypothetical protein
LYYYYFYFFKKKGLISTIAGTGKFGFSTGDGGNPLNANLNRPTGIVFDNSTGKIFFSDIDSAIISVLYN